MSKNRRVMAGQTFYVIGGEYADTSFSNLIPGTELEVYGPFASERDAKVRWRELTGKTVDNAMIRYFLKHAEHDATKKDCWVVGGEYADTSFSRLAKGVDLEVYGPFTASDALMFWRGISAKTIDDAMVRYDVRENYEQSN